MASIPIVSNFEGDFVLQLVEIETGDSMDVVAAKCAHHSLGRRVKARTGTRLRVRLQDADSAFGRMQTVSEVGLQSMDTLEIFFETISDE